MTTEPQDQTPEPADSVQSEMEAALAGMEQEPSPEDLLAPTAEDGPRFHRGKIAGVTGPDVFVELGPRVQGVIPVTEFGEAPKLGETFDFVVTGKENDLYLLSRSEVKTLASWKEIEPGKIVTARVTGQNTGGLELKIGPIAAFMPASHAALQHVDDLSKFLGDSMVCQVLEVERRRKRVLISRRAVLERELREQRAKSISTIAVGQIVKGTVSRLESFGAFVEIAPGIEGLLHVSNISRKRVNDPADVLAPGQKIEVQILKIENDGRRIGLGMKQLEPNPWDDITTRFAVDSVLTGRVVRVTNFGAFVEIGDGIEGLVHVSQLGGARGRPINDLAKVGEDITVRVLAIEPDRERVSLSRLDKRGHVIGSVDEADDAEMEDVLRDDRGDSGGGGGGGGGGGLNLGDLLRKAMEEKGKPLT